MPWAVLGCSHQLGEAELMVGTHPGTTKVLQGVILTSSVGLLSPQVTEEVLLQQGRFVLSQIGFWITLYHL